MKNYSQFIKEEVDLRGNKGIPDNFMRDANRQAQSNLEVRVDDPRQMQRFGRELMEVVEDSKRILLQGSREEVENRFGRLEELAKNMILSKYNDILSAGAGDKPIELDIKLIRPNSSVANELPDIREVPARPNTNNNRPNRPNRPNNENDEGGETEVEITDDEIKDAIHKKKLLNTLNQGEAKATKEIIHLARPQIVEIFGEQSGNQIFNFWLQITEIANKMDWAMPNELKAQMMKNQPGGMAGACQVKWEKEEETQDEEEGQDQEEGQYQEEGQDQEETQDQEEGQDQEEQEYNDGVEEIGDPNDFDKVIIKAVGVDFPMLLHEAIKGIFQLLQSGSIKDDKEVAKIVAKNTSSFEDESQDFKYGVPAQAMFRDFINACNGANRYNEMRARVYAKLALDKDRGGSFTDAEFLETTKAMFASFDLNTQAGKLEFILNQDRFNASTAKRNIEIIINEITSAEEEYESQMREWESGNSLDNNQGEETSYSNDDNDSFNNFLSDSGISAAGTNETPVDDGNYSDEDLKNMRQRDIRELVDDALDTGDYKEVERLSKFLKEGKEIYLKELARINESHKLHGRRKNIK